MSRGEREREIELMREREVAKFTNASVAPRREVREREKKKQRE